MKFTCSEIASGGFWGPKNGCGGGGDSRALTARPLYETLTCLARHHCDLLVMCHVLQLSTHCSATLKGNITLQCCSDNYCICMLPACLPCCLLVNNYPCAYAAGLSNWFCPAFGVCLSSKKNLATGRIRAFSDF